MKEVEGGEWQEKIREDKRVGGGERDYGVKKEGSEKCCVFFFKQKTAYEILA